MTLQLTPKDAKLLHEILDKELFSLKERLNHFQFLDTYDTDAFPSRVETPLLEKIQQIHTLQNHLQFAERGAA